MPNIAVKAAMKKPEPKPQKMYQALRELSQAIALYEDSGDATAVVTTARNMLEQMMYDNTSSHAVLHVPAKGCIPSDPPMDLTMPEIMYLKAEGHCEVRLTSIRSVVFRALGKGA